MPIRCASIEQLKDGEKLRVGVRKEMMPWGRERLAEAAYETAVTENSKEHPDRCKVLWNLDCATNLNPQFLEAIQMKEELTGRVVTTSDNSSIRRFVQERIMAEQANPPATRPAPHAVPISATTQPMSTGPMSPSTQPMVAAQGPTTKPAIAYLDIKPTPPATRPTAINDNSAFKTEEENAQPTKVTDTKSAADEDMDDK